MLTQVVPHLSFLIKIWIWSRNWNYNFTSKWI